MHIALFTPLLPAKTALADIIEGYLPYLAERMDVTAVTSGDYQPASAVARPDHTPHIQVMPYQQFRASATTFDLVVYNLGDEPNIHGYMFDELHELPGVILLHDLVMHHAIFQRTWAQGNKEAYLAELSYSYGAQVAEQIVQGIYAGQYEMLASQYPLIERILDSSLAVVVFNDYLLKRVHGLAPDLPAVSLPYPFYIPNQPVQNTIQALRQRLGGENKAIFASFGLFNSQKRLEVALRAYKRLHESYPETAYVLVGTALERELASQLADLGLTASVITTGWLPPAQFVEYMYAVDVAVQLRYPHVGGTPYTPIRLLGLGVPTIISDIEPQADIPSDAVIRIPPDRADEESRLYEAMESLLLHPEKRQQMAEAGRNYAREHHDTAAAVNSLATFLQQIYEQRTELLERVSRRFRSTSGHFPASDLIYQVGKALAEMGVYTTDTGLLRALAGPIDDLSPHDS